MPTRSRILVPALALLAWVLALSGCVIAPGTVAAPVPSSTAPAPARTPEPPSEPPEPAPEPTPSDDPWALTPGGIGDLRVGKPAANSTLVTYDPEFCTRGTPKGWWDEAWNPGRWITVDPNLGLSLWVDDAGIVQVIDVRNPALSTPEGFAVGKPVGTEIRMTHHGLRQGPGAIDSTMEYLSTPEGNLGFEIGTDPSLGSYNAVDLVLNIQITAPGREPYGWNSSDAIAGGCL
ncbi:hypothetical protein FVA74_07325 [Salinibacterium sp. dk2585]|uniref:hypothetical protein n=1 Tax=unclassified Salinibacterium TaxID=2632331 RepID=UPI0011C254E4|nr:MULTISPECIES: hypothetical protein [unclassified Salinibacterium]QEE61408.1 hypothetical protein FVA74_07325 [Salinibacterium sp. dk2585]TXK54085.1 hypothetical protein FVP63_08775 [Salinibacterium sp. dk5596]